MCRWAAYVGPDIFLEDIVCSPCHSLIAQSQNALEAKTPTNGDGFGVAWYGDRDDPGLYRDVLPAWSDQNLKNICRQIRSPLFLAHVRATTGASVSRENCHPFTFGRWSFMHNGKIGGFEYLRRSLEAGLSDRAHAQRAGATDSELLFLMMVDEGLDADPGGAARRAVEKLLEASIAAGVRPQLRITCAFSDGERLFAIRYATDRFAPSLYIRGSGCSTGHCIVSEPLDDADANWTAIPAGSLVTATADAFAIGEFSPAAIDRSLQLSA